MAKPVRGAILDVDGTLVDSNDAHARAWVEALAEHGIAAEFEKTRRLIGMGGDNLLPEIAGIEEDTPRGKQISERRGEIFKEKYLPSIKPLPGSRELLKRMKEEGLKLVVASSAKEDELKPLLEIAGATDLIEEKTSSDDAENSKPDPDIIHAALDSAGLSAEESIMLGDTPYDIDAARKAGVSVIALRSGGWKDDELTGAVAVYDDPADLLAHYDESPLKRS
ncbi:MAG TPA: HAD family hydrolase [Blastocatellia bacterium]|jgi:HAD superfamily hydrolase (TIGR01509 family)|nr:HAD family hydrolase [Blastocatellia bacterium]